MQKLWRDVHHRLITYTGDLLSQRLPSDLHLFIEERVIFETDDDEGFPPVRAYLPGVSIFEAKFETLASDASKGSTVAVAAPAIIRFPPQPITEAYIEIRDSLRGGQVITTIEFLSPTNKVAGPAKEAFVQKQTDMKSGRVSLVEIDLIRGGDWVLAIPEYAVRESLRTSLRIAITQGWVAGLGVRYSIKLDQRLPTIPIPLRQRQDPIALDLQAAFDLCYERGRYGNLIDYRSEPDPPLTLEERAWADKLLRDAGRR